GGKTRVQTLATAGAAATYSRPRKAPRPTLDHRYPGRGLRPHSSGVWWGSRPRVRRLGRPRLRAAEPVGPAPRLPCARDDRRVEQLPPPHHVVPRGERLGPHFSEILPRDEHRHPCRERGTRLRADPPPLGSPRGSGIRRTPLRNPSDACGVGCLDLRTEGRALRVLLPGRRDRLLALPRAARLALARRCLRVVPALLPIQGDGGGVPFHHGPPRLLEAPPRLHREGHGG